MNIHLAHYSNIGPFANRDILVHFPNGKYMIQSPVGTGKSFLFFDAIVFGLYTELDRKVVNVNCDQANIYIVFSVGEDMYMIHRNITPTKSSQSTKSKLYTYNFNKSKYISNIQDKLPNNIIIPDHKLEEYLDFKDWQSIEFKNETDLKTHLKYLIPPREVFLNRNIFMQSSDDIFTIPNNERINIFKNIFGLLDIDIIKEQLNDRAKEVKGMITIKKNNNSHEQSFRQYIYNIQNIIQTFAQENQQIPANLVKFFEENELLLDKMSLGDISIGEFTIEQNIYDNIQSQKTKYQNIYINLQTITNEITNTEQENYKIQKDLSDNTNKINNLTQELGNFDPKKLDNLKLQKTNLLQIIQNQENIYINNPYIKQLGINNRDNLINYINAQIQLGKDLKSEIIQIDAELETIKSKHDNINNQIIGLQKSLDQELSHNKSLQDNQKLSDIKNLQNQISSINNTILQKQKEQEIIAERLQKLESEQESQNNFYCKKYGIDCPFIGQINEKVISRTQTIIESTKSELNNTNIYISQELQNIQKITNEITKFSEQSYDENTAKQIKSKYISNIQKLEQELQNINYETSIQEKLDKKSQNEKQIDGIREVLKSINFQEIQHTQSTLQNTRIELQSVEITINKLESDGSNISQIQQQIDQINITNNIYNQKLSENSNKVIELNQNLLITKQELESVNIDNIQKYENNINKIQDNTNKLIYIYDQYIEDSKLLKLLEDEEKTLKDLTGIFGKELMLLVLQEFLPALEDEINNLLNRVVDYEIRFEINDNGDKMEINIKDGHQFREVKSLSGGQKAILRLCWILAIARRSHNEFLFLDETINNLDTDKIASIAELIQDFVEHNNIKFYSITHSTQIQNMSIRDQIINVKENL